MALLNAVTAPAAINTSGTYYVKATEPVNNCSVSKAVTVNIRTQPVIQVTDPAAVCNPATINLTAAEITAGSDAGLVYSYWRDAVQTNPLQDPQTVTASGTYYIKGTTTGGCSSALPVRVTINALPTGTLEQPAVSFICAGSALTLTTVSNAARYQWFKDRAILSTATSAVYGATTAGTYTVQFISQEGCIRTADNNVVLNLIQKPVVQFTAAAACAGLTTSFSNRSVFTASGSINWIWNFGNGSSSNAFSASHVYPAGGGYTVALTADNRSCPSLTERIQIPVTIESTRAGLRYETVVAAAGKEFTLTGRAFGTSYTWQPSSGLRNPSASSTTGVLTQDAEYTLSIVTQQGCKTIDTVTVTVSHMGEIYLPRAFSPNGDGVNDILYPQLAAIQKLNYFRVFNRWGNLIFQTSDPAPANGWNGKHNGILQSPGSYAWMVEAVDIAGNIIRRSGNIILVN
jgi:gliding motility-associated-like protein